jgi:hypothetical protein
MQEVRKMVFIEGMNAKIGVRWRRSGVHKKDENQNWSEMEEKWCS